MDIITQHYDNARTGLYDKEKTLKPDVVGGEVKEKEFRKTHEYMVDGSVYAQPLVANDVKLNSTTVDIVIVATMHNSVYAFNLKDHSRLWRRGLVRSPNESGNAKEEEKGYSIQLPHFDIGQGPGDLERRSGIPQFKDIAWEVGILSTAVIALPGADRKAEAASIYVVSTNQDTAHNHITHTLWQLRLSDGTAMASTLIKPDKIVKKANVLGVKDFASKRQIQRPGLALNKAGDKLYIAFAGYNDMEPFAAGCFVMRPAR
jgi:hypothetical protein